MQFLRIIKKIWNSPTATSWLYFTVVPLRLFILTPLVLSHFSKEELDAFFLFSSSMVLASVIEFRLGDTFDKLLSFAVAHGENRYQRESPIESDADYKDNDLFIKARQTQRSLTLILLAPVGIFCGLLGWMSLGRLTDWDYSKNCLWVAMILCVSTSLFSIMLSPLLSNLKSLDRTAVSNRLGLSLAILTIISSAIGILLGARLVEVCGIQFVFSLVSYFIFKKYQPEQVKNNPLKGWKMDRKVLQDSWMPLLRGTLMHLATFGTMRSAGVIMAGNQAPGQLAQFIFAQNLLITLSNFSSSALFSQIPRYSRELVHGQGSAVVKDGLIRIGLSLTFMICGIIAAPMVANVMFPIIHSQVDFLDFATWVVLSISFTLYNTQNLLCILLDVTNKQIFYAKFLFSSFLVIIGLFLVNQLCDSAPLWMYCLMLSAPYFIVINFQPMIKLRDLGGSKNVECWKWILKGGFIYFESLLKKKSDNS